MSAAAILQSGRPDDTLVKGEYLLTRKDLAEIAGMIYSDAGIALNETKASLVYSRLSKRLRQIGPPTALRDYCDLVGSAAGADERREMLSFLTTNFTRFFRETIISIISARSFFPIFSRGPGPAVGSGSGRRAAPMARNPTRLP